MRHSLSLCHEGCGSVDTPPRFQCMGQRTKSQRDARMSIYVTGCPRQYMSNKDTQGCSALDPDQRTKYLRDARMSIYVNGCPRQYMSNKDTQGCSALDPGQRTKYLTDARMSIYVTGSPRQYMSNKYTQECSALGTKTRVRPSVSRPTRHAVRARRRCSALEGM